MDDFLNENLCHDPIHGYISFVASDTGAEWEICERQIIDHPWVQRMRQIRQLQSAWWVFPTAEHSRFQHVLGVMHLASRAVERLYDSLKAADPSVPAKSYVDCLMRMTGLLHDVGHGPFGHFFDEHYLRHFGLTHEKLGAFIIEQELRDSLIRLRRTPMGTFGDDSPLRPEDIAWLIQRPVPGESVDKRPKWMHCLRSLFCGIYTVDNMDFVLRDAFMTGLSPKSYDLSRILHYSSFTEKGLTIHDRGMPALVHFLSVKAELFRSVYFHRSVRAIDLELADLFRISRDYLFPGDPREHLQAYQEFTEFSLLTDVRRWRSSHDPKLSDIGQRWQGWLKRSVPWVMVCQRNVSFGEDQSEGASIFSNSRVFQECLRDSLPPDLRSLPFHVDLARHIHRPHTVGATAGMNFFYDSSARKIRPLTVHGLYRKLPVSHTIARVYALNREHEAVFSQILDDLLGSASEDDLTNM